MKVRRVLIISGLALFFLGVSILNISVNPQAPLKSKLSLEVLQSVRADGECDPVGSYCWYDSVNCCCEGGSSVCGYCDPC